MAAIRRLFTMTAEGGRTYLTIESLSINPIGKGSNLLLTVNALAVNGQQRGSGGAF